MKVFKFGGASVKDAAGVRNVARVLQHFPGEDILVVVSAMGKTTNALEEILWDWRKGVNVQSRVEVLKQRHLTLMEEVLPDPVEAKEELQQSFSSLEAYLSEVPSEDPDLDYDQIVWRGEMWSSIVLFNFLGAHRRCSHIDARRVVRTDALFRSARVDWKASLKSIESEKHIWTGEKPFLIVTQGFIGATEDGFTTTLGREGSDFSAAIFAYLLDAESVTIWKDVPGMFNADPNRFPDTKLLSHISYREAIELSYFGASVIHPRTLQPLQQKHIPLYVRSFMDLAAPGSIINDHSESDSLIPSFIIKPKQLLISITPRDLSFIVEENLSHIFGLFARRNVRIDLMQNSALAFSVVVDDMPRAHELIAELNAAYEVRYNADCELVTVRHYDEATLEKLTAGREVLIEQRSRVTARFVLK